MIAVPLFMTAVGIDTSGVNHARAASQPLPEERLKKLPEKLHPQLQPVAAAMRENKKVLYQESLLQEMEKDLERVD